MRVELPQGYFSVPDLRMPDWIMMGIFGLLLLISVLLVLILGLDKKPDKDSDFHAMEFMTPPEIGCIFKGYVDDSDVVSLLFYWADRGYLSIHEENENVELHKLKDMDIEAKPFEKHLFAKIFEKSTFIKAQDVDYLGHTILSIKSMIKLSFDKDNHHIFTQRSMKARPFISFMMALPVIMTLVLSLIRADIGIPVLVEGIMSIIFGIILLFPFFTFVELLHKWQSSKARWKKFSFRLVLTLIFFAAFLWITLSKAREPALPWLAVLATFLIGFCSAAVLKRTAYSLEWMGKIEGFKDYIKMCRKDRLFMEQDPCYFYHLMPYGYVLNLMDGWPREYEKLMSSPPNWYYGSSPDFSLYWFLYFFNNTIYTFENYMSAVPPSNTSSGAGGGSGFSGGSSSGGGGGGGGGGVW